MSSRRLARAVSKLPGNTLRVAGYRLIGYEVGRDVRIGRNTVIEAEVCKLGDGVNIGAGCFIAGREFHAGQNVRIAPNVRCRSDVCTLAEGADIRHRCLFAVTEFHAGKNLYVDHCTEFRGAGGVVRIGAQVHIRGEHIIDGAGGFTIGDNSYIAGRRSQFWTHGHSRLLRDPSITIGRGVYIGSAVICLPGSSIPDGSLVVAGSVVSHRFREPYCVIGGNPARVIARSYYWYDTWFDPNVRVLPRLPGPAPARPRGREVDQAEGEPSCTHDCTVEELPVEADAG